MDFDVASMDLKKGDYIEPKTLGEMTDTKPGTTQYAFALIGIRNRIEDEYPGLVCKMEGQGIRVLSDKEASEYTHRRFREGLQTMKRSHSRALRVDRSQLPQPSAHDRRLQIQEHVIRAAESAYGKEIPLVAHNGNGVKKKRLK